MQTSFLQRMAHLTAGYAPFFLAAGAGLVIGTFNLVPEGFASKLLAVLMIVFAAFLYWHHRRGKEIAQFAQRLDGLEVTSPNVPPMARLRASVATAERRLLELSARTIDRHGVTGLPTREVLLSKMADDCAGTIGVISFADFNRLCAFDPALADRALIQFAGRITRMVGRDSLVAHVDRSDFVLWFGPDEASPDVRARLIAICYALSEMLADECLDLIPETRVYQAAYLTTSEQPSHALSRALAACASGTRVNSAKSAELSVDQVREDYGLEQDLRTALAQNEFELLYQPQIDAYSGRVCGAEALLRWNNPLRGVISPNKFVPLLESTGLIGDVGIWALNAACREARTWQSRESGTISIAVNISSCQLESGDLAVRIERILELHELPARAIEIELTETVAAADLGRAAEFFQNLRSKGISSAIDDFGTGFSSLSSLRSLSFDKIKIDREFVSEVDRRSDSQAICQSIIALARGLGIRVLAEGVERQEEYLWLRKHGCNEFQGYYFSKPLSSSEIGPFFSHKSALAALLAPERAYSQIASN
ncbi:putative bifunctional diguanylate cyclase/phosphodiesterase [Allopontixanthobacter sediminis]|nr:EAL domain-containing protein [Allopontixanthobacter sediminis]